MSENDSQSETLPAKRTRSRVRNRFDHNPFLGPVVATLTGSKRKIPVAMNPQMSTIDHETGEIAPVEGQITKYIAADREGFVKLYTAQLDAFFELKANARKVVKYVIHMHQQNPNKHRVTLHPAYAADDGYEMAKSSWYDGLNELIDKKFIAAAQAQNDFYLNPAIFFNGDRTKLVVEISRKPTDQSTRDRLEKQGQERLAFDDGGK